MDLLGSNRQVTNECLHLLVAIVSRPQNRRRMHRGHHERREFGWNKRAALAQDAEILPEKRLGGSHSHTDEDLWPDHFDLGIEPGSAGLDLGVPGLLVDPALAALMGSPTEMLYGIGDVDPRPIDSGRGERFVEDSSCGTNEWPALEIFFVAWLFSHKHYRGVLCTLSKHGLCRTQIQIASFAGSRGALEIRQASRFRQESRCTRKHFVLCHTKRTLNHATEMSQVDVFFPQFLQNPGSI